MESRSGIMPPINLGPALPVSAIDTRTARSANGGGVRTEKAASPPHGLGLGLVKSDALDPGQPPVDLERTQLIRKAVETGNYPIVPAKVADAMIAAGLLLRTAK
jgi:negative regulator of flagellin synthesis FlgM